MKLKNTRYLQYVSALTANLSVGAVSMYVSWTSPILPKISAGNSPLGRITESESSWIVSSLQLGTIPGSILSAWIINKFGRKGSLLLSGIPLLIPWLIIPFTSSVLLICLLRFLAGIAQSIAIASATVYNGEIAEKDIRGKLGATFNFMGILGEFFILSLGPFVSYLALTLSCAIVPLMFLIIFYFMPESPYYLIKVKKEEKAKKNLRRLMSNNVDDGEIKNHLEEVKNIVEDDMKNKSTLWEYLSKEEYRKSLIITLGVQTIQQLSGFAAIATYMQTIIESSKSSISPEISSIIFGFMQFPAVIIAGAIVDKVGRKPLYIISALGLAVALAAEGTYFYLQDILHADVSSISWLPTTGLIVYLLLRPLGVGTLPYIIMGELFATNIKEMAMLVSGFYNCILSFIVAKSFEPVSNYWGMHVMFWVFSSICILGSIFVYFVQPETKGKTFAEIQEKLNRGKRGKTKDNFNLREVPEKY